MNFVQRPALDRARQHEKMQREGGQDVVRGARPGTAFAKTTRPTIGSVVARDALFARLDQPTGRPGLGVSGPPGAGATPARGGRGRPRSPPVTSRLADCNRSGIRSTRMMRTPRLSSTT